MSELIFKTAHELADLLEKKEISSEELTNAQFERIEKTEKYIIY